jgi:hypothetical protein
VYVDPKPVIWTKSAGEILEKVARAKQAVESQHWGRALFPFIERIFADAAYQGPRAANAAAATGRWIVDIVKRNELHH